MCFDTLTSVVVLGLEALACVVSLVWHKTGPTPIRYDTVDLRALKS